MKMIAFWAGESFSRANCTEDSRLTRKVTDRTRYTLRQVLDIARPPMLPCRVFVVPTRTPIFPVPTPVSSRPRRFRTVIKTAVASRYAKALFELLDDSSVEPVRAGLTALAHAYSETEALRHVLASPVFRPEDKITVLAELSRRLQMPPVTTRFLAQLVHKNRVGFLMDISIAFAQLADQAKGARQVKVVSARTLEAKEQDSLRARLREVLKRDIELNVQTDPGLLSGLRIQIGSTVFDSSIRNRLTAIRTALTKE